MLPRLLLVVGLSVAVMLPLIWGAFAPVPDLREVSETDADPVHNGPAVAERRRATTPEAVEPSNPTARSEETTIGTAPDSEREASAARSDDLPGAGHSEPTEIKPSLPQAFDKNAAPEPLLSEAAKPLPEEAKPPQKEAKRPPEKAKPPPGEATTPAVSEGEASAARSGDLPGAEPTEIKPSLPQALNKEAAPEPVLTEKAKPLPEEAKPLQKEAKRPPEKAKRPPEEATTPTVSEREASGTRSDDLPGAGRSEPTEVKPSLPRAFDKDAAPEPLVSEKAEPSAEEAATPAVNVEKPPEVKEGDSAPAATRNGRARARAHGTERQKTHSKKQRDHSGWVGIMREAGWLAPGQRQ